MERNEERLNELTPLIVDSGAVSSPLFVPSKIDKRYSDLAVCLAGQAAESRCEGLETRGAFHDKIF